MSPEALEWMSVDWVPVEKPCCVCGVPFKGHRTRVVGPCCAEKQYIESGGSWAASVVARARKMGMLLPATTYPCEDCGKPAKQYDHRDYNRPLDVAPVCCSCNSRRGSAIPIDPDLDKKQLAKKLLGKLKADKPPSFKSSKQIAKECVGSELLAKALKSAKREQA